MKEKSISNIGVIGAGSWGTALAHHLSSSSQNKVEIWGPKQSVLDEIDSSHTNSDYFPNQVLSPNLKSASDLASLCRSKDAVVISVPSKAFREVAKELAPLISESTLIISTAKGLEPISLKRMSEVLVEELGHEQRIVSLSGPSFALEVVKNLPTAVTIAGSSTEELKKAVSLFHSKTFRVYSSDDLVGVELGGVIKNVIALAAGMIDGAQMGNNARAALISRGMVELKRVAVGLGAKESTVYGLSGLGDLVLTATSDLSRNRRVGLGLGAGKSLESVVSELGQVAEAVRSASLVLGLAQKIGVEVPIVEQVEKVMAGESNVKEAIACLFSREQTQE